MNCTGTVFVNSQMLNGSLPNCSGLGHARHAAACRDQKPDVVTPTAVGLSSRLQGQAAAGSSGGQAGGDGRSSVDPDAAIAASQAIAAAAAATKTGAIAEPAVGGGTGGMSGRCMGNLSCIADDAPLVTWAPALLAAMMPLMSMQLLH